MRLAVFASSAAMVLLSGCAAMWDSYEYEFFPVCDADAPAHLRVEVAANEDAQQVGKQARQDGWVNVYVDNNWWYPAVVSGDCPLSDLEDSK